MKKILFILFILVLGSRFANCQCIQTNCQDSLASNITKDTLIVAPGYTNIQWTKFAGPGTVNASGTSISGLLPGTTTVLWLQANQGNSQVITSKVITVAPLPAIIPVQRTVSGVTVTLSDGTVIIR